MSLSNRLDINNLHCYLKTLHLEDIACSRMSAVFISAGT